MQINFKHAIPGCLSYKLFGICKNEKNELDNHYCTTQIVNQIANKYTDHLCIGYKDHA